MHASLIQLISQYVKLTDDDIALCKELFEPVLYPRNRIIEEAGKKTKYLYFVNAGYIRLFHYDENGNETVKDVAMFSGLQQDFDSKNR